MLSITSRTTNVNGTYRANTVSFEEARKWIGRRLILKKPLLEFLPDTLCVVMCVVDFGDGPLLWIVTDDKLSIDVDQLELSTISDYFRLIQSETLDRTA